jgi:hypothetical protein
LILFSKNLTDGCMTTTIMTSKGPKYIKCGKGAKPSGVFQRGGQQTIITETGCVTVGIPTGVVIRGKVNVKSTL